MIQKNKLLTTYQKQKILRELRNSIPELFDEDCLNLSKFKNYLGSDKVVDDVNYGLNWFGKKESRKEVKKAITKKLIPNKEKSLHPEQGQNLLIEGDNLDALKLLQEEYHQKIKLIYLDPPYNKGKHFAYTDRFQQSSSQYLDYLNENNPGRVDTFLQHQIESGEIHTNWLNMIYPRLILTKELLTDDGLLVISIDESEKSNLQLICNEIFGEENFVACFIWENRSIANDAHLQFSTTHEYILVYGKNAAQVKFKGEAKDLSAYSNPDQDPQGDWVRDNPSASSGNEKLLFPIVNPHTGEEYLPPKGRYWAFARERVEEWTASGKLVFPKEKGKRFLLKKYKSELKSFYKSLPSVISDIPTAKGTKELKELYPEGAPFQYPKPTDLLEKIFEQLTKDGDLILDLFAGSGSTADAIFKLNEKEKSSRHFICVQVKELIRNANSPFKYMPDFTRDRIIRAGKLYKDTDVGFTYLEIR